jgi:hypothetical protein
MNMDHILEADVVVCGGGMAGTTAAVAAARAGAKTVLIERYGFLGGNATAGAVGQFNGWQTASGRPVIGGIAREIVSSLEKIGGSNGHSTWIMSTGHKMDRVEYSPEVLKLVLDDMIMAAGVIPLFHSVVSGIETSARRIKRVSALAKGEDIQIKCQVVIDASGDLDVLQRAGAAFLELGSTESLQPATMMFRFGPIDLDTFNAISPADLARLAHRGVESGYLARAALHMSKVPQSNDGWFNVSRLAVDATDPFALSHAEIDGRRQAAKAAQYLTATVPGCANGRLVSFGTQVGIRETRRVQGDYVLTADDLRKAVEFSDTIAVGAYPIDIHPATGSDLKYEELGEDHSYNIPFRALIPSAIENALAVGRGISASHEANAAIRVMPIAMAIGQAAGLAAASAAATRSSIRDVDVSALRIKLLESGAILR